MRSPAKWNSMIQIKRHEAKVFESLSYCFRFHQKKPRACKNTNSYCMNMFLYHGIYDSQNYNESK